MRDYQINITDGHLVVSCEGMDDLDIALNDRKVAVAYIVRFSETTVSNEPGYSKTTYINGIEDVIYVEKSKLRPDDMIETLDMDEDYLFMAVYEDDDEVTTPYYIKLL